MNDSYISSFFSSLSSKMRKENDLSDITWAMCQASSMFMDSFVHFFFPEVDIHSIIEFVRESPDEQDGGSRVDFLFRVRNDATPYLIEVKINDRNQHFGQYDKAYNVTPERLGYITNYPLSEKGYDKIRQWEQFYDLMEDKIKLFPESEEINLIKGYLSYVKNVCGIIKFTKLMNITGLYSMFELFTILKNSTQRETKDFSISTYGPYEITHGSNLKIWFTIEYKNPELKNIKEGGVIGIWYNKENPEISIGFQNKEQWGKSLFPVLKKMENNEILIDTKYCETPYDGDDNTMYISMKDSVVKEIDNASNVDKQTEIILNYIDEALMLPIKFIK